MEPTERKAIAVKILFLDVDGVLTDGRITYNSAGEELKSFHIHDGLGIKLLQQAGVTVVIITGRNSSMVSRRATELDIQHLVQGREDKRQAMEQLLQQLALSPEEAAYMGDDLPDLAAIQHAGLGIAPANAVAIVRQHADFVTLHRGGEGAVREACEFILTAQGRLSQQHAHYQG